MQRNIQLIELVNAKHVQDDGFLTVIQAKVDVPIEIKRVFYITKPEKGLPRGYHTHLKNFQILFCIQGKVKMVLDNGFVRGSVVLNKPNVGILLRPFVWHEMLDLDENSILLVLASEYYDANDYVRDYSQFRKIINDEKANKV